MLFRCVENYFSKNLLTQLTAILIIIFFYLKFIKSKN